MVAFRPDLSCFGGRPEVVLKNVSHMGVSCLLGWYFFVSSGGWMDRWMVLPYLPVSMCVVRLRLLLIVLGTKYR